MLRTSVAHAVLASIALCAVLASSGCASRQPQATRPAVVVRESPPPRRVIARPPPPMASAVWIPGQWRWNGYRYVWLPGYWEMYPRGIWVPGYWRPAPGGWVWVYGYWR